MKTLQAPRKMKKTKAGMIPVDWEVVRLKQLLIGQVKNGFSPNCVEEQTGRYILGLGNLTENGLNLVNLKNIPVNENRVTPYLLKAGDFLISRSNTCDKVGRCALFRGYSHNCYYPDLMMRFRVIQSEVVNGYLEKYLQSSFSQKYFQRHASGTSGSMVKITKSVVEKAPIILPSLSEQKAIVDLLSIWDEAIDKTEWLIQAKEKRFKWYIQKLINQRCNSWTHIKPVKIFDIITEKNFPNEELLSVTQDRGVIPRSMLKGRVMSPEGTTATYKLIKRGDYAISLRSFQGGIEYSEYLGIISPAYTVLRPKIEVDNDFYKFFFKAYIFIEKYLNLAVIGIRDGKQISIPDFMSIKIPAPSIEEQKFIAETLNIAQQEIDLLKQLADKYKTQKRGLMQKLLTGEWRVKIKR